MAERKTAAYLWYPRDFAADEHVVLMTLEEEGAYRRLLDHQWLHGSIPADIGQLAAICKHAPRGKMLKIFHKIAPCFTLSEDGNRYTNPRLERTRQELEEYRLRRSEAGRKGNNVRWQTDRVAIANGSHSSPSPSPSPSTAAVAAVERRSGEESEGWLARFPEEYRGTVQAALRAAHNPHALKAELDAVASGMHPPAYDYPTIGRALHDLAVAGSKVTSMSLRGFCRTIAATPTQKAGLFDED